MMRSLTVGFVFALVLGSAAHAANVGVIPTKLIVVDKLAGAGKAKTVYVSKDQAAGITKGASTDPTQITVRFDVVYGNGSAAGAFTLPAGASNGTDGWLVNKTTVAKYVNKDAPSGPTQAKVGVVKPGKLLKLVGKGLGDEPLDIFGVGDPGAEGVQTAYCVTNGGEETCHCSAFTGCAYKLIADETGAKLVCKTGAADPACVAAPVSTVTTTTTTIPPGGCLGDADCASGQVCSDGTCMTDLECLQPFEPTQQLALDIFGAGLDEDGNFEPTPTCGDTNPLCCPGGTPASSCGPLHAQLTSASITEGSALRFDVSYDMELTTISDLPIFIPLAGECLLHIDTTQGTQSTIRLDAPLNLTPDRFRILSVGDATVTGLESSDVSIGGGLACQLANFSISFFIDNVRNLLVEMLRPQVGECRFCDSTVGACSYFDVCTSAADCESGVCQPYSVNPGDQHCAFPHCGNAAQDGGELHVDCGGLSSGSGCFGCPTGQTCIDDFDCLSLTCVGGLCQ